MLQDSQKNCLLLGGHSACYEVLTGTERKSAHSHVYYDAFMSASKSTFLTEKLGFRARESCEASTISHHVINTTDGASISILLVRPKPSFGCGLGNQLGMFYEAVSFGLASGYLIGRLDPLFDGTPGIEGKTSKVLTYLPRLIIPRNLSTTELKYCGTIDRWPWENTKSYFWKSQQFLGKMVRKTMTDYSIASRSVTEKISERVGIHFRCGDNFFNENYGIFTFHVYRSIFEDIAKRFKLKQFVIYTDVNKHGHFGHLCWNFLGELQQLIKETRGLNDSNVMVDFSSPDIAVSRLHLSKVVVCSVSTFCYFASFGSSYVYQPRSNKLFRDPDIMRKIKYFKGGKVFDPKLLRPLAFPSMTSMQFTQMVLHTKRNNSAGLF